MKTRSKLTIGQKLSWGFGGILSLLVVVSAVGGIQLRSIDQGYLEFIQKTETKEQAQKISQYMWEALAQQKDFMNSQDLRSNTASEVALTNALTTADSLTNSAAAQETLEQLQSTIALLQKHQQLSNQWVNLYKKRGLQQDQGVLGNLRENSQSMEAFLQSNDAEPFLALFLSLRLKGTAYFNTVEEEVALELRRTLQPSLLNFPTHLENSRLEEEDQSTLLELTEAYTNTAIETSKQRLTGSNLHDFVKQDLLRFFEDDENPIRIVDFTSMVNRYSVRDGFRDTLLKELAAFPNQTAEGMILFDRDHEAGFTKSFPNSERLHEKMDSLFEDFKFWTIAEFEREFSAEAELVKSTMNFSVTRHKPLYQYVEFVQTLEEPRFRENLLQRQSLGQFRQYVEQFVLPDDLKQSVVQHFDLGNFVQHIENHPGLSEESKAAFIVEINAHRLNSIQNLLDTIKASPFEDSLKTQLLPMIQDFQHNFHLVFQNDISEWDELFGFFRPETRKSQDFFEAANQTADDIQRFLESRLIRNADSLLKTLLILEKQYLANPDSDTIQKLKSTVVQFKTNVSLSRLNEAEKEAIHQILDSYQAAFEALVASDTAIQSRAADLERNLGSVVEQVGAVMHFEETSAQELVERIHSATEWSFYIIVFLSGLGVLLAGTIAVWVPRSIKRVLVNALKKLNIATSEQDIASDEISKSSYDLATSSVEQAQALENTASALEEISAMTQSNAENALRAKDLTAGSKEEIQSLSSAMHGIHEASGRITGITKTIDMIAFQTNILSLNAAVEAARAGEAGQGFAVVADEVRSLALKSAEAAQDIANKIDDNVRKTEAGMIIAERVYQSFETISQRIEEITTACQEQTQGLNQVNHGALEMEQATHRNASSAEHNHELSSQLKAHAETLKEIVNELKTMTGVSLELQTLPMSLGDPSLVPAEVKNDEALKVA